MEDQRFFGTGEDSVERVLDEIKLLVESSSRIFFDISSRRSRTGFCRICNRLIKKKFFKDHLARGHSLKDIKKFVDSYEYE